MLTDRQREAMDHSRSLCVTAGAGAGKTRVLVEKYISLLEEGVQVSQILALTFTEKAAAEMKERVRRAIRKKEGRRWRDMEEEFNWARISTFHSFCASVLRDHPFEAGISPGFQVLEGLELDRVLREAYEELVSHPPSQEVERALVNLLVHLTRGQLMGALHSMYFQRGEVEAFLFGVKDLQGFWEEVVSRSRANLVQELLSREDFLSALKDLAELSAKCPQEDGGTRYLNKVAPHLSVILDSDDEEEIFDSLCQVGEHTNRKKVGSKGSWTEEDRETLNQARRTITDVLEELSPENLERENEEFAQQIRDHFEDLVTCYRAFIRTVDREKGRLNALDFGDMIMRVHMLLQDEEFQAGFERRFRYVLVDEFQDTDRLQYDIVRRIIGGLVLGTEKLFIVGDPKQSIYLFRGIDVSMFKEAQKQVSQIGGGHVPLDICFRCSRPLVDFHNQVFERLMPPSGREFEFEYHHMRVADHREGDDGTVELLLTEGDQPVRGEAESVARRIRQMVEGNEKPVYWEGDDHLESPRPLRYGDITVLLRTRKHLRYYQWALEREGVPYHVHSGMGFYRRQEIKDLYSLLSFLENERNDVALYGLLRSPHFSLSDDLLYRIVNQEGFSLWKRLGNYVDDHQELQWIVDLISGWMEQAHRLPVGRLIPLVLSDTGVYAVYGGLPDGEQSIANLEKMMGIARDYREGSLTDFMTWFSRAMRESPREGQAALDLETGDCVNIMTVHAAKGLEFPVVVVPDMSHTPGGNRDPIIFDRDLGVGMKAPDPTDGHQLKDTCIKRIIMDRYRERERAESKRQLYVALTRAKDHLVMSGQAPSLEERKNPSWMDLIARACSLGEEDIETGYKDLEGIRMTIGTGEEGISQPPPREPLEIDASTEARIESRYDRSVVEVPEEEREFAPTMVEDYIACPKRYHWRHEKGVPEFGISGPSFNDPTVKGDMVHEVMAGKDPSLVLGRRGVQDPSKERQYWEMRDRFLRSQPMSDVEEEYRELPFRFRYQGTLFKGKMDRLVRRNGGWTIIDYKSGKVDPSDVEGEAGKYWVQMAVYREAARRMLGEEVHAMIYFPYIDRFQEMEIGDDAMDQVLRYVGMIEEGIFSFDHCSECGRDRERGEMKGECPVLEDLQY
ncbi:MAG: UvrD-helicase domain-containing protein [Methanomassiliicoccales archaeon]